MKISEFDINGIEVLCNFRAADSPTEKKRADWLAKNICEECFRDVSPLIVSPTEDEDGYYALQIVRADGKRIEKQALELLRVFASGWLARDRNR